MNKQQVSFGQGFHPKLQIEPQFGRAGTSFRFKATHFDPDTYVQVSIIAPNGQHAYDNTLATDDSGNLGYGKLERRAEQDWPLGRYRFVVSGKSDGKKV